MRTLLHSFLFVSALALWIASCSLPPKNTGSGNTRRSLDAYYIPSDVVKYLLPEVPNWANGSIAGGCHRLENIRYFDAKEVGGSFGLSYFDILQAQINFNQEKQNVLMVARQAPDLDSSKLLGLPPKQEELLFYQALDRVQAKFYSFQAPTFKRINLLWIDPYLAWSETPATLPKLKPGMASKLMNNNWSQSGHPVMVSFCLTALELEKVLEHEKIADHNIRMLGTEAMSPYTPDLTIAAGAKFYLSAYFNKDQELHFYSHGKFMPEEIEGPVTLHDF